MQIHSTGQFFESDARNSMDRQSRAEQSMQEGSILDSRTKRAFHSIHHLLVPFHSLRLRAN
jgi:hypothetical protein